MWESFKPREYLNTEIPELAELAFLLFLLCFSKSLILYRKILLVFITKKMVDQ